MSDVDASRSSRARLVRWVYVVLAAATLSQHAGLLFLFVTVPTTLRQQGASLTQVGLFAFVFVPFALQFLWAPWVEDRRRRGTAGWRPWFLATQAALGLGFGALAFVPLAAPHLVALVGIAIALAVAAGTQKIAMGGLAIEALRGPERAAGNAALGAGSALGSVAGTIGLVWLAASQGWRTALLTACLGTLALGIVDAFVPRTAPMAAAGTARPSLVRLFRRRSTWRQVGRLVLVGLPLGLPFGLVQPRLTDAGLDLQAIGLVTGLGQLALWIAAGPLVTFAVGRLGPDRAQGAVLLGSGILLSAATAATFAAPAAIPAAILSAGAGIAALVGVSIATYTGLMRDAERGDQAATEFSVYLSLYGLVILLGAGLSGLLADLAGYAAVLALAAGLAVLAAIVLPATRRFLADDDRT